MFTGPTYKLFLSFMDILDAYMSFIPNFGKFNGSGGHSNRNCLHDLIVLVFNSACVSMVLAILCAYIHGITCNLLKLALYSYGLL